MIVYDRRGIGLELPDPPPHHYPTGIADLRMESAIKRHVLMVLDYCEGNQKWAAQELGVKPSTIWRWIQEWQSQSDASAPRIIRYQFRKSRRNRRREAQTA